MYIFLSGFSLLYDGLTFTLPVHHQPQLAFLLPPPLLLPSQVPQMPFVLNPFLNRMSMPSQFSHLPLLNQFPHPLTGPFPHPVFVQRPIPAAFPLPTGITLTRRQHFERIATDVHSQGVLQQQQQQHQQQQTIPMNNEGTDRNAGARPFLEQFYQDGTTTIDFFVFDWQIGSYIPGLTLKVLEFDYAERVPFRNGTTAPGINILLENEQHLRVHICAREARATQLSNTLLVGGTYRFMHLNVRPKRDFGQSVNYSLAFNFGSSVHLIQQQGGPISHNQQTMQGGGPTMPIRQAEQHPPTLLPQTINVQQQQQSVPSPLNERQQSVQPTQGEHPQPHQPVPNVVQPQQQQPNHQFLALDHDNDDQLLNQIFLNPQISSSASPSRRRNNTNAGRGRGRGRGRGGGARHRANVRQQHQSESILSSQSQTVQVLSPSELQHGQGLTREQCDNILPNLEVNEAMVRNDERCVICQMGFDLGSLNATELPCKHLYHLSCARDRLMHQNRCAICMRRFVLDSDA
ncbi:hypothetical protein niasHT_015297 [Heterodera trifolii]|uniref:RING-type domain-containing protein n=1 Tax=Heterodera trifolii TaxID=157864 RepID=A0ABD2L3F9_9BILA